MDVDLGGFDHPSWVTAVGTGLGYLLILVAMTAALFLVPYVLFTAL